MNRLFQGRFILPALLVLLTAPGLVEFYTDWLWFGETNHQQVFLRTLSAQTTLGAAVGLFAFAVLVINIRMALRQFTARQLVFASREGPITLAIDPRRIRHGATVAAGVAAVALGLFASGRWLEWLQFVHMQPFGDIDPVLGRDAGFYVFRLPFLDTVSGMLLTLVLLSGTASVAAYALTGALDFDRDRGIRVAPRAKQHLMILAAGGLLVLAFGAYLELPRILTTPAGIIHGAASVDVAIRMPALRALMIAALVGAGLALYQIVSVSWWPITLAIGLYIVTLAGGSAAAAVMHRFVIAPNEQARETPYIQHNIAATRKAFALDQVEERQLTGDVLLTRNDIDANAATLGNVRLWDPQPLLQTFAQIQEIRTYYDFVSVHNDRYAIDGQDRQIMLSARELNSQSLPNRNWINERLTFTHGYGLTLGPVNQVTPEGLPMLFIKDLPPQSSVDLRVDEPSIYFGQLSNDYVFVKTKAREFHYPKGEDNVYTTYEGNGGVPVSSLFRRLLFSLRFQSFKVLLSDDITSESRVLFHRRLADRVARIAPFLTYDPAPYLVISNGRLLWMQDAYTTSRRYPYSTPAPDGTNYIRSSVKVTVDAYHGTTTFYVVDEQDPVLRTLANAFPALFRPIGEMPADLRGRLRYPEGIFKLQTAMYATYHMTNPAVFYNKEDQWDVPSIGAEPNTPAMEPYYTMMKLPGEQAAEFIQMLPFTPARKDNLASWMVARSDGDDYGKMIVFQFPKQKVVFGPRQIVARINQDQAIAPQITLWNQQGSEVLQGTLLVVPIEESLIYIRPLYLRSAGGRIPELKRVIVAHQNQIVMEDTLEQALNRLFPREGATGPAAAVPRADPDADERPAEDNDSALARASQHYHRAMQAQREGDWARYGDEIRQLGQLLDAMNKKP